MDATETLTGSSDSSSETSGSPSESSNSSAENSDDELPHKPAAAPNQPKEDASPKDPVQEARKYNQRFSLLMERINAINQVPVAFC
jgi:hypothetical protein